MLFINETKRSELPDSEFGIPEDRKFPLDTKEHVQSAIKLFGHAEESKKKSLAKKIASKAKKYDIEIPENTQVYKYLNESYVIEGLFGQQVGDIHKLEDPKYAKELSKKIRETPAKEYEDRKNKIGLLTLLQTISIVGVVTAPLALIFSACISAAKRSCTKEDELNKMVYLIDLCIKNTEAQISSRAVPESEKEKLRKAVKNLEDNKKYFTSKKEVTKKYKDYKNQLIVINDSPFVGAFSLTGVILDGYECKPEYIKEIESTNDLPVEGYIEGLAVMNKQEILKLLDKNKYENNENGYEKVPRGKTISDLYYNNGDVIAYCYDDNKCYCFNDKYADEPLVKVSLDKVLNAANKAYSDLKKIIKDEDISSLNESYGYKSDFTYYNEGVFEESSKNNYKKIYDITMKMFKDSGRLPNADNGELKQFLATGKTDEFGGALCIAGLGTGFEGTCSKINKEIKPLGGKISADNYGTAMLSVKEDTIFNESKSPLITLNCTYNADLLCTMLMINCINDNIKNKKSMVYTMNEKLKQIIHKDFYVKIITYYKSHQVHDYNYVVYSIIHNIPDSELNSEYEYIKNHLLKGFDKIIDTFKSLYLYSFKYEFDNIYKETYKFDMMKNSKKLESVFDFLGIQNIKDNIHILLNPLDSDYYSGYGIFTKYDSYIVLSEGNMNPPEFNIHEYLHKYINPLIEDNKNNLNNYFKYFSKDRNKTLIKDSYSDFTTYVSEALVRCTDAFISMRNSGLIVYGINYKKYEYLKDFSISEVFIKYLYDYIDQDKYNYIEYFNNVFDNSLFESTLLEEDIELPSDIEDTDKSITELLDSTDPKKVYLTSDWHIFQTHYKKEHNYVNTSEIISWCKQNIKDNDVFLYLGDMSYRWVNDEDKAKVKEIFKSLPGIKILVIGNHDEFSDGGNYEEYGFKYAVKEIHYKNIIFTHKPIDMHDKPDMLNIHGHMHKWAEYNTTDGSANVNVYPAYYNNKPITLDRIINHKDYYMRNNKRSDWSGMGESTNLIEECIDMIENQLNKENNVNEWAMASFNPVIGIQKPYVLKAVDDTGSCINSKLYALSPDVISDKYLVVDESSKLSIVDKSYFDNYNLEVYEYTGNELNVGKIKEAYDNGDIVSPNYIYETLSGKELLSIDQIDFDENFSKVDLDAINAETESAIHTIQANWDKINGALFYVPNINNEVSLRFNDALDVLEDLNGFYLENRLTHKRTKSVPDIENITEAMYNSVI